jgi:hypothetical protein
MTLPVKAVERSHADYMDEQLHALLVQLKVEYPVKMLASLAGCSSSLVYAWAEPSRPKEARYLFSLAGMLAERGDYRLVHLILPPGVRLVAEEPPVVMPNGSSEDEVTDGAIALAQAALAHRGHNPDAVAQARSVLREIEQRLEGEELLLRARAGGAVR